jgi:hypothetical protein
MPAGEGFPREISEKEMGMEEHWSPEDRVRLEESIAEKIRPWLLQQATKGLDHHDNGESREDRRRSAAYHEAAHAVIHVVNGDTVSYVTIETPGTDYKDLCKGIGRFESVPRGGIFPAPDKSLDYAVATLAGNIAEGTQAGETNHWGSWEELNEVCDMLEKCRGSYGVDSKDIINVRKYCEAAALWGQQEQRFLLSPGYQPKYAPPPPPSTEEDAYVEALEIAEQKVHLWWATIENVAEKLMEIGHLTGKEVEEIVSDSSNTLESD